MNQPCVINIKCKNMIFYVLGGLKAHTNFKFALHSKLYMVQVKLNGTSHKFEIKITLTCRG